jgi:hypothetical protein
MLLAFDDGGLVLKGSYVEVGVTGRPTAWQYSSYALAAVAGNTPSCIARDTTVARVRRPRVVRQRDDSSAYGPSDWIESHMLKETLGGLSLGMFYIPGLAG